MDSQVIVSVNNFAIMVLQNIYSPLLISTFLQQLVTRFSHCCGGILARSSLLKCLNIATLEGFRA